MMTDRQFQKSPYPQLIQANLKTFKMLLAFVKAAEGLTIGVIESDIADAGTVIKALQEHSDGQAIQFDVMNFPDPNLRFLLDELTDVLPKRPLEVGKKRVLILQDLEHSIGMTGEYPRMLVALNFMRDAYVTDVPHPLLLCLPSYAVTRLGLYAPDFWDWRSGMFLFNSVPAD
jgi:hypothetical protein